jgi:hypothetical protein
VNRITNRLAVPGGWIYEVRNAGVVFVPEPLDTGRPSLSGADSHENAGQASAISGNVLGCGAKIVG